MTYWGHYTCLRGELNVVFRDDEGLRLAQLSSMLMGRHVDAGTAVALRSIGSFKSCSIPAAPFRGDIVLGEIAVHGLREGEMTYGHRLYRLRSEVIRGSATD